MNEERGGSSHYRDGPHFHSRDGKMVGRRARDDDRDGYSRRGGDGYGYSRRRDGYGYGDERDYQRSRHEGPRMSRRRSDAPRFDGMRRDNVRRIDDYYDEYDVEFSRRMALQEGLAASRTTIREQGKMPATMIGGGGMLEGRMHLP